MFPHTKDGHFGIESVPDPFIALRNLKHPMLLEIPLLMQSVLLYTGICRLHMTCFNKL